MTPPPPLSHFVKFCANLVHRELDVWQLLKPLFLDSCQQKAWLSKQVWLLFPSTDHQPMHSSVDNSQRQDYQFVQMRIWSMWLSNYSEQTIVKCRHLVGFSRNVYFSTISWTGGWGDFVGNEISVSGGFLWCLWTIFKGGNETSKTAFA